MPLETSDQDTSKPLNADVARQANSEIDRVNDLLDAVISVEERVHTWMTTAGVVGVVATLFGMGMLALGVTATDDGRLGVFVWAGVALIAIGVLGIVTAVPRANSAHKEVIEALSGTEISKKAAKRRAREARES